MWATPELRDCDQVSRAPTHEVLNAVRQARQIANPRSVYTLQLKILKLPTVFEVAARSQ